jgi:hypothetical protein
MNLIYEISFAQTIPSLNKKPAVRSYPHGRIKETVMKRL